MNTHLKGKSYCLRLCLLHAICVFLKIKAVGVRGGITENFLELNQGVL